MGQIIHPRHVCRVGERLVTHMIESPHIILVSPDSPDSPVYPEPGTVMLASNFSEAFCKLHRIAQGACRVYLEEYALQSAFYRDCLVFESHEAIPFGTLHIGIRLLVLEVPRRYSFARKPGRSCGDSIHNKQQGD